MRPLGCYSTSHQMFPSDDDADADADGGGGGGDDSSSLVNSRCPAGTVTLTEVAHSGCLIHAGARPTRLRFLSFSLSLHHTGTALR